MEYRPGIKSRLRKSEKVLLLVISKNVSWMTYVHYLAVRQWFDNEANDKFYPQPD